MASCPALYEPHTKLMQSLDDLKRLVVLRKSWNDRLFKSTSIHNLIMKSIHELETPNHWIEFDEWLDLWKILASFHSPQRELLTDPDEVRALERYIDKFCEILDYSVPNAWYERCLVKVEKLSAAVSLLANEKIYDTIERWLRFMDNLVIGRGNRSPKQPGEKDFDFSVNILEGGEPRSGTDVVPYKSHTAIKPGVDDREERGKIDVKGKSKECEGNDPTKTPDPTETAVTISNEVWLNNILEKLRALHSEEVKEKKRAGKLDLAIKARSEVHDKEEAITNLRSEIAAMALKIAEFEAVKNTLSAKLERVEGLPPTDVVFSYDSRTDAITPKIPESPHQSTIHKRNSSIDVLQDQVLAPMHPVPKASFPDDRESVEQYDKAMVATTSEKAKQVQNEMDHREEYSAVLAGHIDDLTSVNHDGPDTLDDSDVTSVLDVAELNQELQKSKSRLAETEAELQSLRQSHSSPLSHVDRDHRLVVYAGNAWGRGGVTPGDGTDRRGYSPPPRASAVQGQDGYLEKHVHPQKKGKKQRGRAHPHYQEMEKSHYQGMEKAMLNGFSM